MKRSWFGFILLMVILAIALMVTWVMGEIHRPVSQSLRQAALCALSENWDTAEASLENAQAHWQRWGNVRLCFADHTPVEEIDSSFAALTAYSAKKETADFAAACLTLKEKVEAVSQAHGLTLWNLL